MKGKQGVDETSCCSAKWTENIQRNNEWMEQSRQEAEDMSDVALKQLRAANKKPQMSQAP